jgi:hypothetical protein
MQLRRHKAELARRRSRRPAARFRRAHRPPRAPHTLARRKGADDALRSRSGETEATDAARHMVDSEHESLGAGQPCVPLHSPHHCSPTI